MSYRSGKTDNAKDVHLRQSLWLHKCVYHRCDPNENESNKEKDGATPLSYSNYPAIMSM